MSVWRTGLRPRVLWFVRLAKAKKAQTWVSLWTLWGLHLYPFFSLGVSVIWSLQRWSCEHFDRSDFWLLRMNEGDMVCARRWVGKSGRIVLILVIYIKWRRALMRYWYIYIVFDPRPYSLLYLLQNANSLIHYYFHHRRLEPSFAVSTFVLGISPAFSFCACTNDVTDWMLLHVWFFLEKIWTKSHRRFPDNTNVTSFGNTYRIKYFHYPTLPPISTASKLYWCGTVSWWESDSYA